MLSSSVELAHHDPIRITLISACGRADRECSVLTLSLGLRPLRDRHTTIQYTDEHSYQPVVQLMLGFQEEEGVLSARLIFSYKAAD